MYKTISETVEFLTELDSLTSDIDRKQMELFVIPSFTSLEAACRCVLKNKISLGAQNMGWEDEGQFTGEISPLMLKEVGVNIVEIGHSERRHVFHETNPEINLKVLCSMRHGFTTLLCIGETEEEKNYGITDEVLRIQLKIGLKNVTAEQTGKLWITYEPVWAIGVNGTSASKEYAEEKHSVINRTLIELFGEESGNTIPILYGGSVNLQNAPELIMMPHINGLFIGRSAWQAENFNKIIRSVLFQTFQRTNDQSSNSDSN